MAKFDLQDVLNIVSPIISPYGLVTSFIETKTNGNVKIIDFIDENLLVSANDVVHST